MASWPISTAMLKPAKAMLREDLVKPASARTLANPNPWIRPKANATIQARSRTTGQMLFKAATMTDAAMADSTQRVGSSINLRAARASVIEWAMVKEVR